MEILTYVAVFEFFFRVYVSYVFPTSPVSANAI